MWIHPMPWQSKTWWIDKYPFIDHSPTKKMDEPNFCKINPKFSWLNPNFRSPKRLPFPPCPDSQAKVAPNGDHLAFCLPQDAPKLPSSSGKDGKMLEIYGEPRDFWDTLFFGRLKGPKAPILSAWVPGTWIGMILGQRYMPCCQWIKRHDLEIMKNYPLVNSHITMENHHFWWVNQL